MQLYNYFYKIYQLINVLSHSETSTVLMDDPGRPRHAQTGNTSAHAAASLPSKKPTTMPQPGYLMYIGQLSFFYCSSLGFQYKIWKTIFSKRGLGHATHYEGS